MRAKKSLGQHFLRSERALKKIIEAGEVSAADTILEIGPGQGALTEKLLAVGCQLLAVEKDDELYEFLKNKFREEIENKKLILIHDDILNFDLSKLKAASYKLIANIPYNITGAILEKFLSAEYSPSLCVLLVQKEVAERIVAKDGKESILSISVKVYGKPTYIETVKAGSFVPRPKVDSAIIAINDISKGFFDVDTECQQEEFFRILKAGFKSKRKKLLSNLATIYDKNKVREMFQKLNLDENIRAEDVSLEIWRQLASILIK